MSKITDIVFDVGRVLIDVNHDELQLFLQEHGAGSLSIDEFETKSDLIAYEHGQIDSDTFLENMNRLLTTPVDKQQLTDLWLGMFSPFTEMLELAHKLKAHYGVYLLSNTNPLHWQHIVPKYQLDQICHAMLTSCEIGIMKPDRAIYQLAEQRFELIPGNTLFIDDKLENTIAAEQQGWHTVHHLDINETYSQLNTMGVQI